MLFGPFCTGGRISPSDRTRHICLQAVFRSRLQFFYEKTEKIFVKSGKNC